MDDLLEEYEINEADIEKMIRHLQIARPEDTITPEMALGHFLAKARSSPPHRKVLLIYRAF